MSEALITLLGAFLAAAGFSGAALLALVGKEMSVGARSYAVAVAAGILIALSAGDLFPESLDLAGKLASVGFVGGFALLFVIEMLTRAHTHHFVEGHTPRHALVPFTIGMLIHQLADGFVLGVSGKLSAVVAGVAGIGVIVHQLPVGLSVAAVLSAGYAPRSRVAFIAVLLGLAIPFAATLTMVLPVPSDFYLGLLIGVVGGVLGYLGASHLLPEAQAEHSSKFVGVIFVVTLFLATLGIVTVLAD